MAYLVLISKKIVEKLSSRVDASVIDFDFLTRLLFCMKFRVDVFLFEK